MRQVVLDTETTGLEPQLGHRIIEIGCVEMDDRKYTGRQYHCYLNPDREIDQGAMEVHGISNQFLANKPRFEQVVNDFLAFVDGAELVIHNAPFDIGFINHELVRMQARITDIKQNCSVLDTLALAKAKHPGQRNNLDALCKRYDIDNTQRELHGALLDAEILADVYLAMTSGQSSFLLRDDENEAGGVNNEIRRIDSNRKKLAIIKADSQEREAHEQRLLELDKASNGTCLWAADTN